MVRYHHQLNGHDLEKTLGDSEGQGSLACYSPRGHRVRHDLATEQQQQIHTHLYTSIWHCGIHGVVQTVTEINGFKRGIIIINDTYVGPSVYHALF